MSQQDHNHVTMPRQQPPARRTMSAFRGGYAQVTFDGAQVTFSKLDAASLYPISSTSISLPQASELAQWLLKVCGLVPNQQDKQKGTTHHDL